MSETVSTRTKTLTGSSVSETLVNDSPTADRWTRNITYRHLVVTSCIGIVQLWWHPYIHDLHRLVPFLFLHNMFSIFIGYPMFYLELALGVVTKKGVLNCWDLSPMARGVGISMLITAAFTALATGIVAAWCLALFVHSFHAFLPWLHCAASAEPACAARHRPMSPSSETPSQSFFFNYVLRLKRDGIETGLGTIVTELSVYYAMCWTLIYCICIKRIYSISKLVLFKDTLAYFVLVCYGLGAAKLEGSGQMFAEADWSVLYTDLQIWLEAVEYSLIQMTVSQGTLVMLGSLCPKQQHGLARTTLLAFAASKTSCIVTALILGAAHGALVSDYQTSVNIVNGSSATMVLWSDYVARIPGNQFWSAILFFTLFVLAITSTALIIHTIMSTFTGRSIRKISWAFLVLICLLVLLIGSLALCAQGGLYVLNFIMHWPAQKPRVLIAAVIAPVITYAYGQATFCEDVYFAVGEYPNAFMRVCWAISPLFLVTLFLCGMSERGPVDSVAGRAVVSMTLIPIFLIMFIFLVFKFRIRNIVGTEK